MSRSGLGAAGLMVMVAGCARGDEPPLQDWLDAWAPYLIRSAERRYCDTETGEEIGWLMAPFLNGFCYGYLATGETAWLDRLVDWADAWIARGVTEPDGYLGWPKENGASTGAVTVAFTDNLLGEAMGLEPLVRAARAILADEALAERYGAKAREWLALAERTFDKWTDRGCWREVGDGGVWVVPTFGLDRAGGWDGPYDQRGVDGFTLPANKQNHVARWLLELWDATGKPVYRERAERWFITFRSRLRERDGYLVWNYWDPAGPWDYRPDGTTKHWVGVHPNGGYYSIDIAGIVAAFEHGLVFDQAMIDRLIATNRDFMWNQQLEGARFQRIDGGEPDERWANSPGVLWSALTPYDETLLAIFVAHHSPASWGGLAGTPQLVARQRGRLPAPRR